MLKERWRLVETETDTKTEREIGRDRHKNREGDWQRQRLTQRD